MSGHQPGPETFKVFNVTPGKGLNPVCERDPQNALAWFEEAEPGSVITIEVLEMTEKEYGDLTEYEGP